MSVTDKTLVLGVLSGDKTAFAELYDRRARLVRAICYDSTKDIQVAADLTQEVFLRAFENLNRLRTPERFSAWVAGIARQVCLEWKRKRFRERSALGTYAAQSDDNLVYEEPEQKLVDLRDQIAGLMSHRGKYQSRLTEKERLALHAYYLQERDIEQARTVLGLSRSGFYRVLASACKKLRRLARSREVSS